LRSSAGFYLGLIVGIHIYYGMSGASVAHAAEPINLEQYFAAALKRSETIAGQSELIQQAEERYKQANAARLPTVSGVATQIWQADPPAAAPATPTYLTHQGISRLTVNQPLFRGFSEYAALRQTRALLGAQNEDYQRARVLLLQDVAQNFYTVLALEQDLLNYREEIRQNVAREQDLQARVRIGRSRTSEVLNVQAAISSLRAQVEQLNGQLGAAREVLAFLSGMDASTPLRDSEAPVAQIEPLQTYLSGIEERPDIKASKQRYTAAQESVGVARGAHLPSVDLSGNYYLDRPGYLKDITWDVQLSLTIPLYAGGGTQSRVREALSQRTQAELGLSQARRLAEQEVRAAHAAVMFDLAQREALEKSTEAAAKSYEAQRREYRFGLVTNLDVLQALTALQQNQRALDRARYTTKLDFLKLQTAAARHAVLLPGNTP